MERETTTLTIAEHVVVMKTYLTAREKNIVQQEYFKGTKIDVVASQPRISEFNPGVQYGVRLGLIGQLVTLLDGSAENIIERFEDMPSDTFDEISTAIDDLVAKKK